jgi:hypothetical protein
MVLVAAAMLAGFSGPAPAVALSTNDGSMEMGQTATTNLFTDYTWPIATMTGQGCDSLSTIIEGFAMGGEYTPMTAGNPRVGKCPGQYCAGHRCYDVRACWWLRQGESWQGPCRGMGWVCDLCGNGVWRIYLPSSYSNGLTLINARGREEDFFSGQIVRIYQSKTRDGYILVSHTNWNATVYPHGYFPTGTYVRQNVSNCVYGGHSVSDVPVNW